LCLDADNSNGIHDGVKVQLWSCSGGANQMWFKQWVSNYNGGQYVWFLDAGYHEVLEANGGDNPYGPASQSGDQVQIWPDWHGANQLWSYLDFS
jgi:hypothetical protein